MSIDTTVVIRVLTTVSLAGLLLAVGLRLTFAQLRDALTRSRLGWLLPVNFIAVPLVCLVLIWVMKLPADIAVGMILLAAAPFAPVVPVFARMSRSDLALAAGLTALFPFASAFLTPPVCELALRAIPGAAALRFSFLMNLLVLALTITLPLTAGVLLRYALPRVAQSILRPMEIASEAAGAISLAFVTVVEFDTIRQTGWKAILAMVLACEISVALGYILSGPTLGIRRTMALGTSNRNIALALLLAVDSFAGTPVVGAVVANGLILILLGLAHVAWWRWRPVPGDRA